MVDTGIPRVVGSSSSVDEPSLSPWDRMALAKAALLATEEQEAGSRRQKGGETREDSLAIASADEASSRSSIVSVESTSITSTHRNKHTPPSILRHKSLSACPTASSSSTSLDSYTSLPRRISRKSSSSGTSTSEFGAHRPNEDGAGAGAMRRRSSRVRFTDESGLLHDPTTKSASDMPPSPSRSPRSPLRSSAVEGLREDLARSSKVLNLKLDTRSSIISLGPLSPDQLASCSSPLDRLSSPGFAAEFIPQPLPYPRLSRRASRLSGASSWEGGSSGSGDSMSIVSDPRTPLRDIIDRSSLGSSPRHSVTLSFAPSIRDSFGSIASTFISASGTSSDDSAAFSLPRGTAYHSLLPSANTSPNLDRMPTINRDTWEEDLGLSPRTAPTPVAAETQTVPAALEVVLAGIEPPISPMELTDPFEHIRQAQTEFEFKSEGASPKTDPSRSLDVEATTIHMDAMQNDAPKKTHQRTDSSLSDVLTFPLPPSRLTLGVSITPITTPHLELQTNPMEEMTRSEDENVEAHEICLDTPNPEVEFEEVFAPAIGVSTPPGSPSLAEMMAESREKTRWEDDTALDITSSPLLDVAVSTGILSPGSRKLGASPRRVRPKSVRKSNTNSDLLRSGISLTSGRGWSGSESEEEEFAKAIRDIVRRRSVRPRIGQTKSSASSTSIRAQSQVLQPASVSLIRPPADRLSQLSTNSVLSSVDSAGPLTPNDFDQPLTRPQLPTRTSSISSSRSGSTIPGDFPWGGSAPSSPTGSIRSGKTGSPTRRSFYENLQFDELDLDSKEKKQMKKRMPRPSRQVEGWGKPEILLDDRWDTHSESWNDTCFSDDELSVLRPRKSMSTSLVGIKEEAMTPKRGHSARMGSSELKLERRGLQGGKGAWSLLLNEEMPEMDDIGIAL